MTIHKVGIDIGNSSIKYCSDLGFGEIPSWRSRGPLGRVVVDHNAQISEIHYKGEDLVLGEDSVFGTGFVWKTSEEKSDEVNVPFVLLALARMNITSADIIIGLPISTASNPKLVQRVKDTYSGVKEAVIGGRAVTFDIKTGVLAEPLGTYLSLVTDENFRYQKTSPFFHDSLGIVDVGFRTVDIIVLERGKIATSQNSTMSGMIRFFDMVKRLLESEHGKIRPNEEVQIHRNIINHFGATALQVNGETVRSDFWKKAAQFKMQTARDITDDIHAVLSEIRPKRVMLTGGGALLLKEELMSLNRNFLIASNPRFSNVTGFYRACKAMPDQSSAGGSGAENRDHITAVQSR